MPEVRLPDKWNEWEIVEQVGMGSFGTVYKAERRLGNNSFFSAIKIIHIPLEEQDTEILSREYKDENSLRLCYKDLVESCIEEIHTMEQLKGNSNIVSIEDCYVEEVQEKIGWNIYIRMEFLQNLAQYIRENRLDEADVIRIGIDICNALEQCEKIKIVHRDIKVDNIFVSSLGCFKLGDFGIARKLEKSVDCYSSKGTFSYMAPEVFHGERYGAQADIYSLGLVMYKILNKGRDPFVDVTKQMIYYRDKEEALQRRMSGEALSLPMDASEKLGKIIIKACDYNPIHRYKNAEEFRKALEIAMKPESASLRIKPDKNKKPPKDKKKKKINVTKIIMLPLVILVLGLGAWGINKVVKKQDLNEFSVSDDTTWKEIEAEENSTVEKEKITTKPEQNVEENAATEVDISGCADFQFVKKGDKVEIKRYLFGNKLKQLLEEQEMQENERDQLEKKISLDDFEVDKTTDIQVGESVTMTFTAGDKILKELNIKIKFTKVVKVYNKG